MNDFTSLRNHEAGKLVFLFSHCMFRGSGWIFFTSSNVTDAASHVQRWVVTRYCLITLISNSDSNEKKTRNCIHNPLLNHFEVSLVSYTFIALTRL